jgi:uncharacterized membrane protein YgcG
MFNAAPIPAAQQLHIPPLLLPCVPSTACLLVSNGLTVMVVGTLRSGSRFVPFRYCPVSTMCPVRKIFGCRPKMAAASSASLFTVTEGGAGGDGGTGGGGGAGDGRGGEGGAGGGAGGGGLRASKPSQHSSGKSAHTSTGTKTRNNR